MLWEKLIGSYSAPYSPISYVGGRTFTSTGSTSTLTVSLTSLTGGLASSPSSGDFVVVYYGVSAGSDISLGVTTTGYTEIVELASIDINVANLSVNYKMLSTAETSVVLTAPGPSNGAAVAVHVWRGVNTSTPLDVTSTTATGINSFRVDPPAITPVTSGAIILAGGIGATSGTGTVTFTSSDLDNFRTASPSTTGSYRATIGLGSLIWPGGSVDPAQFGSTSAGTLLDSWAAVTMALRPA